MRYFIELAYDGTRFGGFQVQENSNTIQAELEKALFTFYREPFALTGSSRTDAGVHALQNFFHMDTEKTILPAHVYNLNAILPHEIAVKRIFPVAADAHSRFQATHRIYEYYIYHEKNPFLNNRAWYYPYPLDRDLLGQAAAILMEYEDFTSFSKRNTQAKTRLCNIMESSWSVKNGQLVYRVKSNRFLRGMVKGLVSTMLMVGRKKITLEEFRKVIEAQNCNKAWFDTPAHGLYLVEVGL